MTKEEFKKLKGDELVQPNYPEHQNKGFKISSIDQREGLIEINEVSYFNKTKWYRYENLNRVNYSKVVDNANFDLKDKYTQNQFDEYKERT